MSAGHGGREVAARVVATALVATILGVSGAVVLVIDAGNPTGLPDWLTEAGLLLIAAAAAALVLPAVLPAHYIQIRKGARPRGRRPLRRQPQIPDDGSSLVLPPRDLAG
jgi:hypothetical protein